MVSEQKSIGRRLPFFPSLLTLLRIHLVLVDQSGWAIFAPPKLLTEGECENQLAIWNFALSLTGVVNNLEIAKISTSNWSVTVSAP